MDTKKLRQKILDLAIRGKLVPQDPNDDPASVLLERIRAEKEQLIKEGKIKRSKKSAATDKSHYENVPFEIPENWCWTTIDELLINRDSERVPLSSTIRKKQANKVYDYYGAAGVIDKVEGYLFNEKLLLIGEDGANLLSRSKDNAFFADGKYWVNNHAHVLDCCYKSILTYVAYLINSISLEPFVTGTAQPKLSQDNLNKIPIALPPIKEQARIVAGIEKWVGFIDEIEAGKIELESYIKQTKSNILDLAISGKLVPQDPDDEPAIELLKRINPGFESCDNSHYENLPQGWTIVGLHSVAEIITGSTPSKLNAEYYNGDVPFYKPNDLDQGRHVRCASEHLSQQGKSISRSIPCNSIAVCCIGSIGKCGFIEKEGVTNQQINTIMPNDAIFPLYMYYFCNSSTFIDELKSLSSAVTISIVNKSKLSTIQIPLPPIAEQKRIISVIEKLFSHLDMITAEL